MRPVLLLASSLAFAVATVPCQVTFPDTGTSFDASYLTKPADDPWVIEDARAGDSPSKQYKYRFNVCNNATMPNTDNGNGTNPCERDAQWTQSPGYQYGFSSANNNECYELASPFVEPEFLPFDTYNPARGVIVRMSGGDADWCGYLPEGGHAKRYLEVALDCTPGLKDNIPDVEFIYNQYACQYQIYLTSHWGCPLECMSGPDDTICSDRGVCGYNRDAQRSQCYCDTGYAGTHCEGTASKSGGGVSVEGAFLIVACLLLVFVISMTVFMYIKVRKLQVDPNAYENLQGRFNELGQVM